MAASPSPSAVSWLGVWLVIGVFLSFCNPSSASTSSTTQWIEYTENDGQTIWLDDNRQPALYTQNFGDCQGGSLIDVTRFDAAYYKDNMTVLFHLVGNSALTNESLMLYIGVFAYGEQRFELTFNPCFANIYSLCPLNSSVPIEASGIIPVAPIDVAAISSLALSIPDFEGQAILRIFANSTESQIGCFSAVVTNGSTFSHPAAVGTILGVFAVVAVVASVAAAAYGPTIPDARKHYAHSISVFVVFSVFQHIFFTGALSMNWPSVLVAFWSNYAWSAGMIYSAQMQNSINQFIGSNRGNISMVGAAPSGVNSNVGGGYQISQIYRRALSLSSEAWQGLGRAFRPRAFGHALTKRDLANSSSGFSWYGEPVKPGLPLPGNFSGFAGTLAQENIPASNAFLTGFLWLLILIALVGGTMASMKWILEGLGRWNLVKSDRLQLFRQHWLSFTFSAVLRTCFIAFFMMIFLTTFQFTLGGSTGIKAIAGVVFAIFFLGMMGVAGYALFIRLRSAKFVSESDKLNYERRKAGFFSWYSFIRESKFREKGEVKAFSGSIPWWRIHFVDNDVDRVHVHDDVEYMRKFGWLASRFRRSKWWFFSFWLVYEFVRACFYGGAAGHALTQVFGLLVVEAIVLFLIVFLKPFESNRLNLLMVYFLGFSKVVTVALSSAFDARFGLNRITTAIIGIVIIAIQGVLTILLMIAVVVGAISSYMSVTRYREEFKPKSWTDRRTRFLAHVDQRATDRPARRPPTSAPAPEPEVPTEPYFKVASVRREPKIEDEDEGNQAGKLNELDHLGGGSRLPYPGGHSEPRISRTHSLRSRTSASNLPSGARRHRASWSSRDFGQAFDDRPKSGTPSRMSVEGSLDSPPRHQAASPRVPLRSGPPPTPLKLDNPDIHVEKRRRRRTNSDFGKRSSGGVVEGESSKMLPEQESDRLV